MSEHTPLYEWSLDEARRLNERDEWRASYNANCECARDIEQAIRDNYKDNTLGECAKPLIAKYGYDRVNWVLANTVRRNHSDGRYSEDNKRWSRTFRIPTEGYCKDYAVSSHPGLVDLVIGQARRAWQALGLYDYSHCESESEGRLDYTQKVLVIDPRIFDDKYKTPEDQLFYATGGNGCRPNASGRKINGFFLRDGEQTIYSRMEVVGLLKDEHLPDWARDKIAERYPPDEGETESEGITMGGM